MVEHVIAHTPALRDAFGLVECPMDAEVNSALAVLFFGLRERRESARTQRTNVSVAGLCHSIDLIRYKRERDVIRSKKSAQRLKESASKSGVA